MSKQDQEALLRCFLGNDHNLRSYLLIRRLDEIVAGPGADSGNFQKVVADIFNWVFKDHLRLIDLESEIDGGKKRVDILYRNLSERGFFADIQNRHHIPCPYIPVECKNCSVDPANPEIDQLLGRFGRDLGRFGFLVCNQIHRPEGVTARCVASAKAGRGWIIALDREDLRNLVLKHMLPAPEAPGDHWSDLRQRLDALLL
jgi:hypothetical protein